MEKYLRRIPGVMALMAAVFLLLLTEIDCQENNTALNSQPTDGNATLSNVPLNAASNEIGNISEASSQKSAFSDALCKMGEGLNEDAFNTSSLNKDDASFQINYGGIKSEFHIGQAEKPVRDLEKAVFVCDIV